MLNEDKYLGFVMEIAKKNGKMFILDSGEGNDIMDSDTGWYIEDLSGWLIDKQQYKQFLEAVKKGEEYTLFSEEYVFALWKKDNNGSLEIEFKKY